MKRWFTLLAVATASLGIAALGLVAPANAQHSGPYCGITWGSLNKSAGTLTTSPITDIRSGRHECYDRIVVDVAAGSGPAGYTVGYVSAVHAQGSGTVVPLRGGAFLQIDLLAPAYQNGAPTYTPANPRELVDVAGYRTFRQAAWGGSFEGYTTVGLGVRARLPFRVLTLDGPGTATRLVIDVAHSW
ncbi:MAG: hypothetical protein H0T85_01770 [Geodermatophilaceae bacterium]|nr:hypothetical protein [Geodermatophilaceae bacterium]